MRLGYHTGYWSAGPPPGAQEAVVAADQLGLDSVWTAEAYGSDAFTPLAWWGSQTSRIRLGTAIAQLSARTPTAAAMAALTLDHLSGGRFVLGLGASGPQVVEGWYGQPYPRPLARTREYVSIVRDVLAREAPVTFDGEFYQLPYVGGAGLGKPLRSTVHPLRAGLPIHLAAEGPKNIALAAEICDGWLPMFYSPRMDATYRELLADGFAKRPAGASPVEGFEVTATVPVVLGEDVEKAADTVRPFIALYAGGMGAKGANFHRDVLDRLGYGEACDEIQAHYLEGRRAEAAAAVPLELVQDIALVGPPESIRAQLPAWKDTAITTMLVQTDPRMLPAIADLLA
ncbi:LLM class F420-dependent oxidoreductase [Cellulomonas chengniuliangii]|uniref:LLM class F420-dependent oxidoreductase n=1 Tax=Cellulomonas chengniuliangii TaxID=2968084 RepID=A0ABY5L4Y3_9CELL|nr:LLM class F420-dependent oxidoreductase [Cellulomonas chengniuliangii]MCC2308984.1 LLM class F420-dependent oxidoreductase [Cellulomonas chengniuliangii]MCC2319377.1 LLM class F420-dependent oxidoreductase [Cellulomonas chengniuliangii]UUI76995.1 LLM class F420-dependent oxidoreductase [Cellulomonas chengniuliangii]